MRRHPTGLDEAMTRSQRGAAVVDLYNVTPSAFRKWYKALAKVRLGLGDAKILCCGDSNVTGYQTSDANRTTKNAWAAQLARMWDSTQTPTVEGMTAPQVNGAILDNRVASTGTWDNLAASANFGWGSLGGIKGYWQCNTDTSTRTVTPGVVWDKCDIYYTTHTGTGTATFTPTGGSAFSMTTGGVTLINATVQKTTVTAGSVSSANTLTIAKTGATTIYVLGLDFYNSTKSQVRIANAGIASSSALGWNSSNASYPNLYSGKCIQAYAPDLTIFSLGSNDANISSRSLQNYLSDMSALITSAQTSGDVLVMSSFPFGLGGSNPTARDLIASYAVGLRGLGVPYLDINTRMGPYAAYNTAGYMNADGLHGNDYAAHDVARWVYNILQPI